MSQDIISKAMSEVFGPEPECTQEKLGYNIAMTKLGQIVRDAEPVLQGQDNNRHLIEPFLRKGFNAVSDPMLTHFPLPAQQKLVDIADRFYHRYCDLTA